MKEKNSIFITGSSGFVGRNLIDFLSIKFDFVLFDKKNFSIDGCETVLHLAGEAHDLKNVLNPSNYYINNTDLTIKIFNEFLASSAKVFITLSSVKAVVDYIDGELDENFLSNPSTHYGISKKLAEDFILSQDVPFDKRVYILRPSMIHGKGNKGNLNLLYQFASTGIPWPLGSFENHRSFCSIDNLLFVVAELVSRVDVPSGVYNICDDVPLSTNQIVSMISQSVGKPILIWKIPKRIIFLVAKIGDFFKLGINSERLTKLTQNFIVSNNKIKTVLGKELPIDSSTGMRNTINSFKVL